MEQQLVERREQGSEDEEILERALEDHPVRAAPDPGKPSGDQQAPADSSTFSTLAPGLRSAESSRRSSCREQEGRGGSGAS